MLEYACSSWNPYTDTDIKCLEQIQKNAALFVCNDYNIATSTLSLVKSESLGWDTLEHRHLFNQSVLFCKFHNNLVNSQTPSPVKSTDKIRSTRSRQLTYCLLQANVSVFNYSSFPRVISVWNLLPYGVVTSSTLSCFRQSVLPAIRSLNAAQVVISYMIPIVYRYVDSYTALFLLVYRGTWLTEVGQDTEAIQDAQVGQDTEASQVPRYTRRKSAV